MPSSTPSKEKCSACLASPAMSPPPPKDGISGASSPTGFFSLRRMKMRSGISSQCFRRFKTPNPGEQIILQTLGLARARQVVGRWGFRGKSLVTDLRFVAPEPWQGVVRPVRPAWFSSRRTCRRFPRGYGAFAIGSFRSGDVNQAFAPILRGVGRPSLKQFSMRPRRRLTTQPLSSSARDASPPWTNGACTQHLAGTMAPGGGRADFLDRGRQLQRVRKGARNAGVSGQRLLPQPIGRGAGPIHEGETAGHGLRTALFARARLSAYFTRRRCPLVGCGSSADRDAGEVVHCSRRHTRTGTCRHCRGGETTRNAGPDGELLRSLECLPPRLSFLNVGTIRDSCWPGAIASYPETAEPFVRQFCGLDVLDAQDAAPSPDLFSLLGIPKRGGSALRTPRANVPKANEIEALLFPSVLAATVDERSFRFLSSRAPFTCVWLEAKYEPPGFGQKMTIEFKFGSGK